MIVVLGALVLLRLFGGREIVCPPTIEWQTDGIPFPIRAVNLEQERVTGMLGAESSSRVVEAAHEHGP